LTVVPSQPIGSRGLEGYLAAQTEGEQMLWPWQWRKVRKAIIRQISRDLFERFGEGIIAEMVSASHSPRAPELIKMYSDELMIKEASQWLTEQGDEKVLHQQRLEFVEWAILAWLIVGVIFDGVLVYQGFFH
jgi:hypothetical protein